MGLKENESVCERQKVIPNKPLKGSIVGLAIDSIGGGVIHGLRHSPENATNGWYIWCGEYSDNVNFFKPICVEHLKDYLHFDLFEYLDLPPGFRFLIDGKGYEDVWYDESLI